jgi:hypothetical protein
MVELSGAVEVAQYVSRGLSGLLIASMAGQVGSQFLQRVAVAQNLAVACVQHIQRMIKTRRCFLGCERDHFASIWYWLMLDGTARP